MVLSKHQFFKLFLQILFVFAFSVSLFGCSGGGGETSTIPASSSLQGVLIDSAVEGVRFESATESGLTNSSGAFTYKEGEVISFFIGDILLGSSPGADLVTPIDFVSGATDETNSEVTNILRFVQTLDSDSNPDNGIQITAATSATLTGQALDFSLSESEFEAVFDVLSGAVLGSISLVSVADAQKHFVNSVDFLNGSVIPAPNGSLLISGTDTESIGITTILDPDFIGASSIPIAGLGADSYQAVLWSKDWHEVNLNLIFEFSKLTILKMGDQVQLIMELTIGVSPIDTVIPQLTQFRYLLNCTGTITTGCGNMNVDYEGQSISFNSVEIPPTDNPGNATAPVTVSGTLSWEFYAE